jgi:hypothetical protein
MGRSRRDRRWISSLRGDGANARSIVEMFVTGPSEGRHVMRTLSAAAVFGALLLVIAVAPSFAQLATITFPDTVAESSSTIKCPTNTVSLCFGTNCSASGTVQSVTGPSAPFSIGKFNVLSNAEFFGGLCEAHPVTLPVTLSPGQILAYQAVFAPTAPGTFNGSLTFNTPAGPATVNLTGKATAAGPSQGLGLVTITVTPDVAIPGNRLELGYEIRRESLTRPVDLYAVVVFPSGDVIFLTETGASTNSLPIRRNVPAADDTVTLFEFFPVDFPFGTYTLRMELVQAGQTPSTDTLASPIDTATVTFAPLSEAQQATLQQRGNPNSYAMFWVDEIHQKRELWLYLSPEPVELVFVNGRLDSSTPLSTPPADGALKVNPGLFTPQTSRAQLVATFGQPTSEVAFEDFEVLNFAGGLEVVFSEGRLSFANTVAP